MDTLSWAMYSASGKRSHVSGENRSRRNERQEGGLAVGTKPQVIPQNCDSWFTSRSQPFSVESGRTWLSSATREAIPAA